MDIETLALAKGYTNKQIKKLSVNGIKGDKGDPGKDAVIDTTLSNSGEAADAKVVGNEISSLKEDIAAITPDDTTVDGKPWTSKKIVDILCPPISETGNPVQCYPVAGYPLGCKVSWEPTQEGSGDPSPDNVRPIKGRDSVTVTRCGEALWSLDKITLQTYNSIITTKIDMDAVNLLPRNVKLYFSGECSNGSLKEIRFFDGIGAEIGVLRANGHHNTGLKSGNIAVVRLYAGLNEDSERTCTNLQITLATTAPTTYTPYTGQTATLTLPRTIYGGTVDAVTGEGQKTWEIIDLANAKISSYGINQYGIANFSLLATSNNIHTTSGTADYFTSSLPKDNNPFNNATKIGIMKANESTFYIRLNETDANNVEMAKAYLASINAKLVYKLANSLPFTATGAQPIPALSGVNTVLTDADSATVTGRADPIKRITDLEDAVASMTTN